MKISPQTIRKSAVYLIGILAVIRFLIMPMHNSLNTKRVLLAEKQGLYAAKHAFFERQPVNMQRDAAWADEKAAANLFYPGDTPLPAVQAEILKGIIEGAEKKGLNVLSFELPDIIKDKEISETPVIVRLSGGIDKIIELMKDIEKSDKILSIKSLDTSKSGNDQFAIITISGFRIEKQKP